MIAILTTIAGNSIEVQDSEIKCYRASGFDKVENCKIYFKDGTEIEVTESFNEIDKIFDL